MSKRLTLQDLAAILAEQTGKDVQETERFLQLFVEIVKDGVFADKVTKVKGIGTFKIVRVEERESISVNSGERFVIPSHSKFAFVPDKDLKELVNKPFSIFETTELGESVDFSDLNEVATESMDTEDVPDGSVEETASQAQLIEEKPKQEETEVSEASSPIAEETIQNRKIEPIETKPKEEIALVSESSRSSGKWIILVTCLVAILFAGVGYIACLSGCFTADELKVQKKEQVALPKQIENPVCAVDSLEGLADTVNIKKDTTTIPAIDTLVSSKPDSDAMADVAVTKIKAGDRLAAIAQKYYGHKFFWVYIYEYNRQIIADPNNIPIGTKIRIPSPQRYGINVKDHASIERAAALQAEILSNEK